MALDLSRHAQRKQMGWCWKKKQQVIVALISSETSRGGMGCLLACLLHAVLWYLIMISIFSDGSPCFPFQWVTVPPYQLLRPEAPPPPLVPTVSQLSSLVLSRLTLPNIPPSHPFLLWILLLAWWSEFAVGNLHPFVCWLRILLSLVSLHSNTDLVIKKKQQLKRIYTRKL